MNSSQHTVKQILADNKFSVIAIGIAVLARIIQLIFFYNVQVDGMYQVMAMQNFTEGHGISLGKVLPGDLSAVVYEPLINWPPGYSLMLSPFYILFGHDYIAAGITLDIVAAVVLIFTCRAILKVLDTPLYLINLFTLLTGFFIYYFYFINSSDAVAISFFMLAMYFTLRLLKNNKFSLKLSLGSSFCLFLCGLIKYLFIPVVFILPAFVFLKGLADKNRATKTAGLLSFVILLLLLGGFLIWQKAIYGSAGYISESARGFFPENIQGFHPALPASFINPDTVSLAIPASSQAGTIVFRLLQALHVVLFLVAGFYIVRSIARNGFRKMTLTDSFFYNGFFLSAAITFLLVILSLTVGKEENIPGHWWTYVEEPRYYGLIHVFVHLGIFVLYYYYKQNRSRQFKYLIITLVVLLLPETFRGILFTARRITRMESEEYSWHIEKDVQLFAASVLKKEMRENENAVVTGSSYYMYYRVGMYSHVPALTEVTAINDLSKLNCSKPTLLLVVLNGNDDEMRYESFLSRPETQFAGEMHGFYFYTTHVKPH